MLPDQKPTGAEPASSGASQTGSSRATTASCSRSSRSRSGPAQKRSKTLEGPRARDRHLVGADRQGQRRLELAREAVALVGEVASGGEALEAGVDRAADGERDAALATLVACRCRRAAALLLRMEAIQRALGVGPILGGDAVEGTRGARARVGAELRELRLGAREGVGIGPGARLGRSGSILRRRRESGEAPEHVAAQRAAARAGGLGHQRGEGRRSRIAEGPEIREGLRRPAAAVGRMPGQHQAPARAGERDVEEPNPLVALDLRAAARGAVEAERCDAAEPVLEVSSGGADARLLRVVLATPLVELEHVDVLEVEALRLVDRHHVDGVVRRRARPALLVLALARSPRGAGARAPPRDRRPSPRAPRRARGRSGRDSRGARRRGDAPPRWPRARATCAAARRRRAADSRSKAARSSASASANATRLASQPSMRARPGTSSESVGGGQRRRRRGAERARRHRRLRDRARPARSGNWRAPERDQRRVGHAHRRRSAAR